MSQQSLSLAEAAARFVATMSPEQRAGSQRELNRFVRWYGGERPAAGLRAQEMADYAEGLSSRVINVTKRLEPVKNFLSYAKKEGLIGSSLVAHLRTSSAKKGAKSRPKMKEATSAPAPLTSQGYAALELELASLKKERPRLAKEIYLAAADKDFRENAPLEAAREQQGQIEARIRDLEGTLKTATVLDEEPLDTVGVVIGCTVTLCYLDSEEEVDYTLVSPSEADPTQGKLSVASPMGGAILGRTTGMIVDVAAPAGRLRYRIVRVKRLTSGHRKIGLVMT